MKTYWVSFAGKEGSRGVVIVDADDEGAAINKLNALKLNPGGEAMLFDMSHPGAQAEVNRRGKNRLIQPTELKDLKKLTEMDKEKRDFIENHPGVSRICDDCNE